MFGTYAATDRPEVDEWTTLHLHQRGMDTAEDVYEKARDLQETLDEVRIEAENELAWEAMDLEELSEAASGLSEDDDDFTFIETLKARRLAQIEEARARARFGFLKPIIRRDYKDEVNDTSCNTVVLLHQDRVQHSRIVRARLQDIAKRFPEVKFLEIRADDCIENFEDKNVPALMIYLGGRMKKQLIGTGACGGRDVTEDELEWKLAELDVLKTELTSDPAKPAIDQGFRGIRLEYD